MPAPIHTHREPSTSQEDLGNCRCGAGAHSGLQLGLVYLAHVRVEEVELLEVGHRRVQDLPDQGAPGVRRPHDAQARRVHDQRLVIAILSVDLQRGEGEDDLELTLI